MNVTLNSPYQAAMEFAHKIIAKGYQFEALHEYTDEIGQSIYWRIRLKHLVTGEKWIRPMYYDGKQYKLGEPKFSNLKPLYGLKNLAEISNTPIFICEGEQCVNSFAEFGLPAVTSGSADSVDKADWSVLANKEAIIWPDNDEAGKRYAERVIAILRQLNCVIKVVNIDLLNLPIKGDIVDWFDMNPNAKAEDIRNIPVLDIVEKNNIANSIISQEPEKQSQASLLVNFVEANAMLFHDQNKEVYAQDITTKETRRLDSRQFRDWLVSSFYQDTGKSARDQSVREALTTLSGLARFRGDCYPVFIRVAHLDNKYYLDLAEPKQSRAIEISANGWKIISVPPVYFIRPENLLPLPEPSRNGDINLLFNLINIPLEAKLLVITWLIECLRPDLPFPVLELIGEQGSAKSTTQTMLRRLIDPNACDLRAAPKTVEDVFVSAGVNWLTSYENISHLSPAMQDALCILATGGGFAKRKLYSDSDETVINVKRPVILNGISVAITAQDLVDRTISLELPIITKRSETSTLWKNYQDLHAILLGGLLDVMVSALARLPNITLPENENARLIEFVKLGVAVAESMNEKGGSFLAQFHASRQEAIARTIDASPVATALIEWFGHRDRQSIQMSANQLFKSIELYRPSNTDAWPRSAKGFADALRRVAPALRQIGIECYSLGKIGGTVQWEIKVKETMS